MKAYIIIFSMAAAAIIGAYWAGGKIAHEKCRTDALATVTGQIIQKVNENNESIRIINEKVFNTSMHDIRDRMREKYTIAD